MIFHNPSGAPELACDQCGCRWFDRTRDNCCYECGSEVSAESIAEFQRALRDFSVRKEPAGDGAERNTGGAGERSE